MANKKVYLMDYGHGGKINGIYQTAGKRSPKFDDGSVLYEGVNNRDNVKRLMDVLEKEGIKAIDIVNSDSDVALSERVRRANLLAKGGECMYISMHSDAHGNGAEWTPASGISVYTSKGQTKSDEFAQIVIDRLQANFGETVKWRTDNTDKDEDKEENFYVLKKTKCPAVLIEAGFHTNKEEATKMLSEDWKNKLTKSLVEAIKIWEEK
jgi:N-acetylmuramoyl-L-alanine amidase